ncbi:hypothetical protein [Paenibacillus glycanilyticus]|uniref:hypothetical protein n=1 Tax=Paenibacillus glycanilyticus TaxID=126569 RepID=UPI000FD9D260|nr:hypothetical protein [Paenibacillus glycanilyticus]
MKYKKILVIAVLLFAYILACMLVDLNGSKIVMDASGRSYTLENHFFYNEYIFSGSHTEFNLKHDRVFLLCTSVVYLVFNLMKKYKGTRR